MFWQVKMSVKALLVIVIVGPYIQHLKTNTVVNILCVFLN